MIDMLVVEPTGCRVLRADPELSTLQGLVGGWIEGVSVADADWFAFCNEDGKMMRLPVNSGATRLAEALGWESMGDYLSGTVVFVGRADPESTDVPESVLTTARHLGLEFAP